MYNSKGKFRFTYFTKNFAETFDFYNSKLKFQLGHSWDRSDNDKGALFEIGTGLIEILHMPQDSQPKNPGLDYRTPQGVYMCIQVFNIDELYSFFKEKEIPFKQEIVDQAWGHRSFSIIEPNGLVLFFFEEQF